MLGYERPDEPVSQSALGLNAATSLDKKGNRGRAL